MVCIVECRYRLSIVLLMTYLRRHPYCNLSKIWKLKNTFRKRHCKKLFYIDNPCRNDQFRLVGCIEELSDIHCPCWLLIILFDIPNNSTNWVIPMAIWTKLWQVMKNFRKIHFTKWAIWLLLLQLLPVTAFQNSLG